MTGLDIFLIGAIVTLAILGALIGFGRASLTALGLFGSLWAATICVGPLSGMMHLRAGGASNSGAVFTLLCLVLGGLSVILARYVHGSLGVHAGMFDSFLGLCAGVGIGLIVAHGFVQAMTIADPDGQGEGAVVASGTVSHEMLEFTSFHSAMNAVTGAGTYRQSLPGAGS